MPARVPLDVDLEDKLLYGLTPVRLAYLVVALVTGFAMWSSHWAPAPVRGCLACLVIAVGAGAAWGRWRGRAVDDWAVDAAIFVLNNHRVSWKRDWRWPKRKALPTAPPAAREAKAPAAENESLANAA